MEALIHHFKLVTEGFRVPAGQVYAAVESPRGELGCHAVSDGGTRPYRVHLRDPSFTNLQSVSAMAEGGLLADVIVGGGQHRPGLRGGQVSDRDGRGGQVMPFSDEVRSSARRRTPTRSSPAIRAPAPPCCPLLHLVQAEEGTSPTTASPTAPSGSGSPSRRWPPVVSFYTMFKRHPVGEYHVGVCTNTLCAIMGRRPDPGRPARAPGRRRRPRATPDGKVSLEHVECNAACDYAPVVMVNWEFFDNMTPDSARDLVDGLRSGAEITLPRGPDRQCTWREAARILAGFPTARREAGPQAGPASLVGPADRQGRLTAGRPAAATGASRQRGRRTVTACSRPSSPPTGTSRTRSRWRATGAAAATRRWRRRCGCRRTTSSAR